MGKIKVTRCEIEGLCIIEPNVFEDTRGYFMETYNFNDMKAAGIDEVFVQDNQSMSTKGVLISYSSFISRMIKVSTFITKFCLFR